MTIYHNQAQIKKQNISISSEKLYLGQIIPDSTPKEFKLEVTPGTFAAERIAISKDGSEIFYSEIKSYYPVNGDKVRYYKYENDKWSESKILFDGFFGPALSLTGDTLFVEHAPHMYYSVREKNGWSSPKIFMKSIDAAHYLQVTNKGNYFISARSAGSVGESDWGKIKITEKDTVAGSFGLPVNRVVDDLDFFMAKDESYMITCPQGPICISYPLENGKWHNGRYLSSKINFGISGWGVYVSPDNKFLFYSTGTKLDYSDVHVYWVSLGNTIDSMKTTNLPPYVKNKPAPLTTEVGKSFSFVVPGDAVCDDDGKVTRYEALSLDGTDLPTWLNFDTKTNTLTGSPVSAGKVIIRINAYDDKGSVTAFGIVLNVEDKQTN